MARTKEQLGIRPSRLCSMSLDTHLPLPACTSGHVRKALRARDDGVYVLVDHRQSRLRFFRHVEHRTEYIGYVPLAEDH